MFSPWKIIQGTGFRHLIMLCAAAGSVHAADAPPASVMVCANPNLPQVEVPRSLDLATAESLFLKYNLSIISARYGIDVATGAKIIAKYTPNPTLSLAAEQFNFEHPFAHPFSDAGTVDQHIYTGRVDQVLEAPGKKKYRTEAAQFQVEAAEAQMQDAIRTNLFQLRQAFYSAVLARENFKVAEENIKSITETEDKLKTNVQGGNIAAVDLIRFQVNKVQFESDRVTAKLNYVQAIRNLLNIIGAHSGSVVSAPAPVPEKPAAVPPAADKPAPPTAEAKAASASEPLVEVVGEFAVQSVDLDLLELQREVETRPDVLAAKRNLDAASSTLHLQRVQRYPDVTVGVEYQRNGPANTVGLALSLPIPLYNNRQGEIKQAEAQINQAKTALDQIRLQALTDVDNGYRAYETALQLLNIYKTETLNKAQEAYRVARTLFDEGQGSRLDVLDAQRTYNQIRVAANQAHYNLIAAIFQLEQATGKRLEK